MPFIAGQSVIGVSSVNQGSGLQLPHIIQAGNGLRPHLGLGQRRQQHGSEDRNNGNDNQQFNQRKTGAPPGTLKSAIETGTMRDLHNSLWDSSPSSNQSAAGGV